MVILAIDLQDGFSDDTVVLRIDGKEVFREQSVTSNAMSGFTKHLEQEVPTGRTSIEVCIDTKKLKQSLLLDVVDDTYLGIFIDADSINFRTGEHPFGYF